MIVLELIIIVGTSFTIIGSALQVCALNYGMVLAAHLILGFGACISSAGTGPLLIECLPIAETGNDEAFYTQFFMVNLSLAVLFI